MLSGCYKKNLTLGLWPKRWPLKPDLLVLGPVAMRMPPHRICRDSSIGTPRKMWGGDQQRTKHLSLAVCGKDMRPTTCL